MKQHILFLVLLYFSATTYSQNIISGSVINSENKALVDANAILKNTSGEIISYNFTDDLGNFLLETNLKGSFTISISAFGYENKIVEINLKQDSEHKKFDFILSPKIEELSEIIIETTRPITVKNDTIVFTAAAFLQGNEQVVEDLLKKIPGLNIDESGNIKIGNQEVEKVMVDGDDLFSKGYKILTKNMPVNPIDKVEVYQNYSNNKHLKGIENSEKVALNLTLKEEARRVWFGNMMAGYGVVSENRYEVKANLMNFGKKNKYYFLTNLNNIGSNATGDINHLIRPYRADEAGILGDEQTAHSLLGISYQTANLNQKRVNLNNAELLSLNSIFSISNKVKLKVLGFLNTNEINYYKNSFQQFSLSNTTFTNIEDFIGLKKQLTGFGKIDLNYDISKTKTLEYTAKFNHTKDNNSSDLLFNDDLLKEKLKANNQLLDHNLLFTNKFKENKVLLLTARYINEKTPQTYSVNQFIFDDIFTEPANNTKQISENKMQFAGVEANFLNKKKNDDLFELKLGNQLRVDQLNTQFQLLQNQNTVAIPDLYQNQLTYQTNNLYLGSKYRFKFKKFAFQTSLHAHQIVNTLQNYDKKKSRSPFFVIPSVGLDWDINSKNKIRTSYSQTTTNATVLNVFSGYVQTGFRSFNKGLESFNQLNASNAMLGYTYGGWGDKFFANAFILHAKNNDFYSTNSVVSQNYSITEAIVIKDRAITTFSSSIDKFFKPIKSNLKINLGTTQTNFKNIVNNSDLREVEMLTITYGVELRSGFKGFFNYHFGTKWNYNQVQTTFTNDFTNNMSFLDFSFIFSEKFNAKLQTERYFFGNLDKQNNTYYFLDLTARYMVKENKLTLFLSGNNLFNTKTFNNYSISDISISQTEYKLMPRYVLLSLEYRF